MINNELKDKLKYLKLPSLIDSWDETIKKRFSNEKLLRYVIEHCYQYKLEKARLSRINRAKIPEKYVIETFPFNKQAKLSKRKIMDMYNSFDYMSKAYNVIWIGREGVGKSGLATSFLMNALDIGHSGRFVVFADLIEDLNNSIANHSTKKIIRVYNNYDLLVIDEMGYVDVDQEPVGLFFRLMQARHKRKPTFITTNLGFKEWGKFLKNDNLTAALIDRITENCEVINMRGCTSLRQNK